MFKKFMMLMLVFSLGLSVVGCGGGDKKKEEPKKEEKKEEKKS